jgi:hypothetical protein
MREIGPGFVAIVASIIGLAMVAVLVSKNAQTGTVLTSAGTALSGIIGAAVGPVSSSQSNMVGAASSNATGSLAGAPG